MEAFYISELRHLAEKFTSLTKYVEALSRELSNLQEVVKNQQDVIEELNNHLRRLERANQQIF